MPVAGPNLTLDRSARTDAVRLPGTAGVPACSGRLPLGAPAHARPQAAGLHLALAGAG